MDIFCPRRMENWNAKMDDTQSISHHYQTIYMVDGNGFDKCLVDLSVARKLMTCRTPDIEKKYTIIFQEVNPNPFGFEFEANENYYLICKQFLSHSGTLISSNSYLEYDLWHLGNRILVRPFPEGM